MTVEEYQDKFFSTLDYISTGLIAPISPLSRRETRYITSRGQDEESWIGTLRNDDGVVDIWLITLVSLTGLPDEQKGGVGTWDKPFSVYIDYFADYRQGYDYDSSNPADIKTNSEREFLKKQIALDYTLENLPSCFPNGIWIINWEQRFSLKAFSTDTTHRAQVVLNLRMDGNIKN